MRRALIVSLLLSSSSLFSGCATTTEIVTEAPGARVLREGDDEQELGVTPYKHTTSMWLWESEKLTIAPARGEAKTIELKRSEVDLLPMAGGACLTLTGVGCIAGVPLILAGGMKLPAETLVELEGSKGKKKAKTAAKKGTVAAAAKGRGGVVY